MKRWLRLLFIPLFFLVAHRSLKAQVDSTGFLFGNMHLDICAIPANSAYDFGTGDFTLELWVNVFPSQPYTNQSLLSNRGTNLNNGMMWFLDNAGRMNFTANGNNYGPAATDLRDSVCHHVAVTRSGTTLTFYVDGVIDGTFTMSENISSSIEIWAGWDEADFANTSYYGIMRELRIWNRHLTMPQLLSGKDTMLLGDETGLVGYWRFNENSGDVLNDLSPTGNNGTRGSFPTTDVNDPDWVVTCPLFLPVIQVKILGEEAICEGDAVTFYVQGDTAWWWVDLAVPNDTISVDSFITVSSTAGMSFVVHGLNFDSDTVTISYKLPEVCLTPVVYELLTPNGDMKNNTFYIEHLEQFPENSVEIYNKWGQVVFSEVGYQNNWSGGDLPDGVYYYLVEVKGFEKAFQGKLVIKR